MLRIILIAALSILPSISIAQSPSVIATADRAMRQLALPYEGKDGEPDGVSFCSSVLIGMTRLLTAEHCVDDAGAVLMGDHPVQLRLLKKSDWLALLEIEQQPGPIMALAKENPRIGDEVATIGWVDMFGTKLRLKRSIAGYSTAKEKYVFLDGPIVQGMSGGPVINALGELVGLNQATNANTGAITPVKDIREFLK